MVLLLQDDGDLVLHGIAPLFTSFGDPGYISDPSSPPPASHDSGSGVDIQKVVQIVQVAGQVATVIESVISLL
jgi:hypothetical protein